MSAGQWTVSATGTDSVTTGTARTGLFGSTSVTSQTVPSGTYRLSEIVNPAGVAGFERTGLACRDTTSNTALTVSSSDDVTLPDGHAVTCTFTNTYRTGSVYLRKALADPAGGYAGHITTDTWTIQYDCGTVNGMAYASSAAVSVGGRATISGIPVGLTCSAWESTPTGNLADSSFHWLTPTVSNPVTVSTSSTPTLTVTNSIARSTGTLRVAKTVAPGPGVTPGYTGGGLRTFAIAYACTLDGRTVASGTVAVPNGATRDVTVPAGASCTTSETAPATQSGDFSAGYYQWSAVSIDKPTVSVAESAIATVTVTNTYTIATVPLTLSKSVVGPGGSARTGYTAGDDTFTIAAQCGDGRTYTATVADGGSTTIQVPRGVVCVLNEASTADNVNESRLDADHDWNPSATRYVDAQGATLPQNSVSTGTDGASATVINQTQMSYGGIAVAKEVAPDAGPVSANTTFTFSVACNAPARGASVNYTASVTLKAGEVWRNTNDPVPAGTDCTVTEQDVAGTSTGLSDASYQWSTTGWRIEYGQEHNNTSGSGTSTLVTAHAASSDAAHPFPRVTFTNTWTRVYGAFGVDKVLGTLADAPAIGTTLTYAGTWTCVYGSGATAITATGRWSRAGVAVGRREEFVAYAAGALESVGLSAAGLGALACRSDIFSSHQTCDVAPGSDVSTGRGIEGGMRSGVSD